ncbi:prophage tail fiber N-terminal domain-containing protein [Enterovibrio sp. 27052020O]|uniref:prophage tail fiber N-terminal domain-containing protein n=1 Tax=Enterovibrio sp. 27052020O TaxID=3241166 RepID=UPI00388D05F4
MIKIIGQLTDAGGTPLSCALLELRVSRSAGETFFNSTVSVKTDDAGQYDFSLKRGEYEVFAQVSRRSDVEHIGSCVVNDDVTGEMTLEELMALTSPLLPESVIEVRESLGEVRLKHADVQQWHIDVERSKVDVTQLEQQAMSHRDSASQSAVLSGQQAALSASERQESGRQAVIATEQASKATLKANAASASAQTAANEKALAVTARGGAEAAASKAEQHESNAASLLQQTSQKATQAAQSASNAANSEQGVADDAALAGQHKDTAALKAEQATAAAGKAEGHEQGAADKLSQSTTQANRAEAEATKAQASADSVGLRGYLPSEAAFLTATQDRARMMTAPGGVISMGKHSNASNVEIVNQGITCRFTDADSANLFLMGRTDSNATGSANSADPAFMLNGVVFHLRHITNKNFNRLYSAAWLLPPAEAGTRVYNNVTGEVVEYDSAPDAFEGLLTNGDFRNGLTGWNAGEKATVHADGVEMRQPAGESNSLVSWLSQNVALTEGEKYRCEATFTAVTDVKVRMRMGHATGSLPGETAHYVTLKAGDTERVTVNLHYNASPYITVEFVASSSSPEQVMVLHNVSVMPVAESVLVNRKDFAYFEAVHMPVVDFVCPDASVQYGGTSWGGLPLVPVTDYVKQGFSAFGPWDTETVGMVIPWATLTLAQKRAVCSHPDMNMYLSDEDQPVQVVGRAKTLAGFGNQWDSVTQWQYVGDGYLCYRSGFRYNSIVNPQGMSDVSSGLGSPDGGVFDSVRTASVDSHKNAPLGAGYFAARDGHSAAYKGRCFALPVALIQRANQGSHFQDANPFGTKQPYDGAVAGLWDALPKWKQFSLAACFDPRKQRHGGNTGSIVSGVTGTRNQYGYYDAIRAGAFQDLRLPIQRIDADGLAENSMVLASNALMRGKGKLPCIARGTLPQLTANYLPYGEVNVTWPVVATVRTCADRGFGSQPNVSWGFIHLSTGDFYRVIVRNTANHTVVKWNPTARAWESTVDNSAISGDPVLFVPITADFSDSVSDMGYVGSVSDAVQSFCAREVLDAFCLPEEHDDMPYVDIISSITALASTFRNGVAGHWNPASLRGDFPNDWPAMSKWDKGHGRLRTQDGGGQWTTLTWDNASENIDNTIRHAHPSVGEHVVSLLFYSALAPFTVPSSNGLVSSTARKVFYSASFLPNFGNRVIASLTQKVGTLASANNVPIGSVAVLDDRGVINGRLSWSSTESDSPTHAPLGVNGGKENAAAVKALYTLTPSNGVYFLQLHFSELTYTQGTANPWGDSVPGTDFSHPHGVIPLVDGNQYDRDLNNALVKVGCHVSAFPVGFV